MQQDYRCTIKWLMLKYRNVSHDMGWSSTYILFHNIQLILKLIKKTTSARALGNVVGNFSDLLTFHWRNNHHVSINHPEHEEVRTAGCNGAKPQAAQKAQDLLTDTTGSTRAGCVWGWGWGGGTEGGQRGSSAALCHAARLAGQLTDTGRKMWGINGATADWDLVPSEMFCGADGPLQELRHTL